MKRISFPDDVNSRLKTFLANNWAGSTPEELAIVWNVENARHNVEEIEVREVLGSMGLLVSDQEIDRIRSLKRKELEIILSAKESVMERIRAERIELMRIRLEEMKDIWTGLESEELAAEKTAAA